MSATIGRRRDWFRILRDLMGAGVSMAEVGAKCGRNRWTVRGWAEGGEPKDSDARVVLALYARHCPVQFELHLREFNIRADIDGTVSAGENRTLPFAGGSHG